MGVVLLFGFVSIGPQLASGLGAALSEQLTKNLDDTAVETCSAPPAERAEPSKKRSDKKTEKSKAADTAC